MGRRDIRFEITGFGQRVTGRLPEALFTPQIIVTIGQFAARSRAANIAILGRTPLPPALVRPGTLTRAGGIVPLVGQVGFVTGGRFGETRQGARILRFLAGPLFAGSAELAVIAFRRFF